MITFNEALNESTTRFFPKYNDSMESLSEMTDYAEAFTKGYEAALLGQELNESLSVAVKYFLPVWRGIPGSWYRMSYFSDGFTEGWVYGNKYKPYEFLKCSTSSKS